MHLNQKYFKVFYNLLCTPFEARVQRNLNRIQVPVYLWFTILVFKLRGNITKDNVHLGDISSNFATQLFPGVIYKFALESYATLAYLHLY